ncbi:hypothetical protein IW139_001407 [Coemansia sp. RSA 353]|nr:hypothetical protein EV181_001971 [Coemansia sp. RSA 532]KAJ2299963.1 hypothetical protein IW139_001407 [Coemansia sp. RSA 353]
MDHRVVTQTLDLERRFIEPVVKAVLHTILFHRYFGNTSVDNTDVQRQVDERVDELMQSLALTGDSKSQISLYFTETKPRRAWFSKSEEEICWEEWIIHINCTVSKSPTEVGQLQASAEDQAKRAIFWVIQEMDKHKDHIPLIASKQSNPFPYHISVAPTSGLWSSMIKRAIPARAPK